MVWLRVRTGRREIAECRFAVREMQPHETAGGVIDVDEQRAGRRTLLEPAVITAVDLNQFTDAGAAIAWLIDLWWPQLARHPQARRNHELPNSFLGEHDAVQLCQFLGCQRRAKIRIAIADQRERRIDQIGRQLVVAGPATAS